MDKTKLSIGLVVGALVIYALYRHFQTSSATASAQTSGSLPVTAVSSPEFSPGNIYVNSSSGQSTVTNPPVSQTIGKQHGTPVYNSGQTIAYPMV